MANFINIENEQNAIKLKNFSYIAIWYWFIWVVFHFTVIFFFWVILQSILLTWLFLWLWNLVALLIDIPIWVLLKYIKPKTMFIIWWIILLIVWTIFIKFIAFPDIIDPEILKEPLWKFWWLITSFINNSTNLVLVIICWILYWVIKEIYDVTTFSYIMNISNSENYANNLSKNNLYSGWGSLFWLILSWVLLSLNQILAVSLLIFFIICFLVFIIVFFDNKDYTISYENIKNFKISGILNNRKVYKTINKEQLKQVFNNFYPNLINKPIFVNPMKLKEKFNFIEFITKCKLEFLDVKNTFFSIPIFLPMIWSLSLIIPFGFLDNFIATFQVEFLNLVIWSNWNNLLVQETKWLITGYVLLWIIIIPAFVMQWYFINLSKKNWAINIMSLWLLFSWVSLIWFWLNHNIFFILLSWLWNSLWYAAWFPLSQAVFSEKYNEHYADIKNLKEIDSNASAAPLKIVWNIANVLWLVVWWLLVTIFWFNWFFIIYWTLLLFILWYTIKNRDKIKI